MNLDELYDRGSVVILPQKEITLGVILCRNISHFIEEYDKVKDILKFYNMRFFLDNIGASEWNGLAVSNSDDSIIYKYCIPDEVDGLPELKELTELDRWVNDKRRI